MTFRLFRLSCLIFIIFFFVRCSSDSWTKYSPGLTYKIISEAEGPKVHPGETIKMHMKQIYRDSLLSTTWDKIPVYQKYDSVQLSPESYRILAQVRVGDSIVFKALSDSAFKNKWPPFAKKGEWLYTHLKIVDILGVNHDIQSDRDRELKKIQAPNP